MSPSPVGKTLPGSIKTQHTISMTPIAFLRSCLHGKASMERESTISHAGLCQCV